MNKVLRGEEALRKLINDWGIKEAHAKRDLEIAAEHGVNVANSGDMLRLVTITRLGSDPYTFSLNEGVPPQENSRKKIPPGSTRARKPGYTSGSENVGTLATGAGGRAGQAANRRDTTMAKAAAETVEDEAVDLTSYLEKEITPTVNDYIDFLNDELGEDAGVDPRSVYYAITLYKFFQGSDFSRERKEARRKERDAAKAAKATANGAEEDEDEGDADEAPKTRRGRKPAAEAPAEKAAPAKRGRPAGKPAAPAAGAPRRRGRPAGKPAGEPAPY